MANEITVVAQLQLLNGLQSNLIETGVANFDQAAQGAASGVQEIGTSEETLSSGDLTNKGWLFLRNIDDTNYVQLGFATGVYGARLEPAEVAIFRTEPAATVYLKADTAACNVQYLWLED